MMSGRIRRSPSHSDENSMVSHEGSGSQTHILEHLATFTVSPENDLVYPADGMRRLLAMEKTNGIWTQKMLMKIEQNMINIMDHENRETVERFPLGLVREPTAFTSSDPKELYNNILIYVVGHPPTESPLPAEMHIFQCVNVRARDVVEDLKSFMNGKRHGNLPSRPGIRRNGSSEVDNPSSPYEDPESERIVGQHIMQANLDADETSSTSSDRYERDVNILNRSFDDIEKFIARLQHAAAAYRELEKRQLGRKSKKKDLGDGMLSVRAKPPPEKEFIDIFQKFKLSFNLLAKLKSHIHDPNAPELVHFLFTPLALIVDASHDSHYGPNLPSKVISPLLSADAVELLVNCLTSKESELWHSLGEAWYIPKQEWKGYVPPYRPVFMDGWSPPVATDEGFTPSNDETDAGNREISESETESPATRLGATRPGMFEDQISKEEFRSGSNEEEEEDHQTNIFDEWVLELTRRGVRVVQVTYPRKANNEKELTVVRGEFLEVIDDSRKWWKARNIRGQIGHVPHTIVAPFESSGSSPMPPIKGTSPPSDWVQKDRKGRKGEFRYF